MTLHPTVEETSDRTPQVAVFEGPIGRRIGRYVVLDQVGAGAMGRVYRAYDPKLRREVALKRLQVDSGSVATARARMLREAQSMAQLSHPNVVPVYDFDVDHGSLYIAMEFVDGDTLRSWLAQGEPTWRSIVAVFLEAGEGLVAAHRQGIVHRDFKPSNVIVGRDGRTRVMDFGLARTAYLPSASDSLDAIDVRELEASADTTDIHTDGLTEHGTVMGTPAYMAPEQHAGKLTDARTDQYAFCTALWEALFGARPYSARDLATLAEAKLSPLPRPPAGAAVPATVHSVVVRGLAVKPQERWPDMETLLAALRRTQARRRPWPAIAVTTVAIAVGGISFAYTSEPPCAPGERELSDLWSDGARQSVRDGLSSSGAGFAASTVGRVDAALQAYAASFSAMHLEACEATRVRHEQSDEALDLRMGCLAARREQLREAVSLFASADASVAEKAVEVATGLSPISDCANLVALRARVPPPSDPQTAQAVENARNELSRARLSLRAGRNADALATSQAASETAGALGYAPLVAEAELAHAQALRALGQVDEAQPKVERALATALRLSMRHAAAEAAVALTGLINARKGRATEAQWLAQVALGLAEGDGTDASLTAEAMLLVGNIHVGDERLLDAEPYFRGAVEHVESRLGPEHPDLVPVLVSWASLLDALHRNAEAQGVSDRARALAEHAFGPDHPSTAAVVRQQAWRLMRHEHYAEAEAAFAEAKAVYEAALGPNHPRLIGLLGTMAGALAEQGRFEEAAASIEEAERRLETGAAAADHPMRASLSHNLASVLVMQGDHPRAIERYRHAIEIRRRLGMKNDLAAALTKMGQSLIALERFEEAREAFDEAERLDVEAHTDDGNRSPYPPLELGKLARRRGDLKDARDRLETAWLFSGNAAAPTVRAEVGLQLGQVLWDLGRDRARGHALVRQALEIAEASEGNAAPGLATAARGWLADHRVPGGQAP